MEGMSSGLLGVCCSGRAKKDGRPTCGYVCQENTPPLNVEEHGQQLS